MNVKPNYPTEPPKTLSEARERLSRARNNHQASEAAPTLALWRAEEPLRAAARHEAEQCLHFIQAHSSGNNNN